MRIRTRIAAALLAAAGLLACACGPAAPPEAAADAELGALLGSVETDYHPGAAGSAQTGISLCGALLDWYVRAGADAETVGLTAGAFCGDFDTEQKADFDSRFLSLCGLSEALTGEGAAALLEQAGYAPAAFPWSEEDRQALFGALCGGLGLELPEPAAKAAFAGGAVWECALGFTLAYDPAVFTPDETDGANALLPAAGAPDGQGALTAQLHGGTTAAGLLAQLASDSGAAAFVSGEMTAGAGNYPVLTIEYAGGENGEDPVHLGYAVTRGDGIILLLQTDCTVRTREECAARLNAMLGTLSLSETAD